ncbi:MAG: hypothetical protein HY706_04315 [Candidatus Hydrogenedentes bacterium]|nr:hypothetical protein [Candidatus Hydrogenedentota bacterium]
MLKRLGLIVGIVLVGCFTAAAGTYSIPQEQIKGQKVYWGKAHAFDKPGGIRYDDVLRATPEYQELKGKKVERGTGKYWILLSQASDRAVRAISRVGQESKYDFIAEHDYLTSVKPAIPAEDITPLVIQAIHGKTTKKAQHRKR